MKKTIVIRRPHQKHMAHELLKQVKPDEDNPIAVTFQTPTRTLDQNAKLHPMLRDIKRQVEWHGNRLTEEEWKDFFTASLRGQRAVPNERGDGFIVLGTHTSRMTKKTFSELIELIYAFGAERGVVWSDEVRN